MHTTRWLRCAAVLALGVVLSARLGAQGITTAAITGTIIDSSTNQPIDGAQIQVVDQATGTVTNAQSRASGVYFVAGLSVGDNYSVTVRRIGFKPDAKQIGTLQLGQRKVVDFALLPQAATLAAVTVQAGNQLNPVINPNRKGTGTLVNDSVLRQAPTLNRNFVDFVKTVPQISTTGPGPSGGGVNNRFNNIQIDGASSNDLFGLGTTGQPGGQSSGKSISLEAVQEYQVLLSPYDLRFGDFNGALINAVTKQGTNEFVGSLFYYYRNQNMAANVPFIRQSDLSVEQYGISAGGPIIKDQLHFFVAGEWQQRTNPSTGPFIGQASSATSPLTVDSATVQRFINDLTNLYGMNAGTGSNITIGNPNTNLFGRLDLALPGINSVLTFRDNYATSSLDVFSRTSTFPLTSNAYTINNSNNGVVLQLTSNMKSGADNELIVGYTSISDLRNPQVGVEPQVTVTLPGLQTATINGVAGAEQFSQGNTLYQKLLEVKDNFSFFAGDVNRVTAGIAFQFWNFTDTFTESSYGVWTFNSLDSLEAGNANRYRVSLALTDPPAVVANPKGATYGAYLQDNWTPSPKFNLTFGLRLDIPVLSNTPPNTLAFDSVFGPTFAALGRQANTSQVPSGNIQWSPRMGFNWDVNGDGMNQVRGGVGVFVGRPAYVWVANSYQNSGSGLGFLMCGRATDPGPITPIFNTSAVTTPPTTCPNGAGIATGVVGPVDIMAPSLKYPQVLRANLAWDTRLPGDFFLTLEALYTQGLNNFFYINRNINYDSAYIGRNGRWMYGTLTGGGVGNPYVVDVSHRFSEVIDVVNQSKDYAYDFTAEIQKRIVRDFQMRVAYTFSHSYDVQSLNSSRAISNWQFGREEGGNLLATNTAPSIYDQPNKLLIAGTYTFPWQKWKTDFTLIYQGYSGSTFDYVYTGSGGRGDLNGDGNTNDMIYVPKNVFDPNEIQFAPIPASGKNPAVAVSTQQLALYNLIQSTSCLRDHQGEIMTRDSCRNPWVNSLDATLVQALPQISGHTVTLRLDIFNLPNMLNSNWGRLRTAGGSTFSDISLLTVAGMTAPVNRQNPTAGIPIVQFQPTYVQYQIQNSAANFYQLQLSARFDW